MRRVKAEGGWGVVCTEQVEIHPTSDITPFIELRIWDGQDIPALARIADAIHEGGALAGIELAHNGPNAPNLYCGAGTVTHGLLREILEDTREEAAGAAAVACRITIDELAGPAGI